MKEQSEKKVENEILITIGQASKRLGIHIDTLRKWDEAGKLKAVRPLGKGWRRYKLSDIYNILNGKTNGSTIKP